MPNISQIEIFKTNIPFRIFFRHAQKTRFTSESIFVKILLDNKVTGFGESLPRVYVTGRTQDSVFGHLIDFSKKFIGFDLKDEASALYFTKNFIGIEGEARCAFEIALLDCIGKTFKKSLSELLGAPINKEVIYSGIISGDSLLKVALVSRKIKLQKFKQVKVKVGLSNDIARLRLCRKILGSDVDLRVDANAGWTKDKALEMIERMRKFKISCIEQPTPKEDIDALSEISEICPEPIMADESLCTKADAQNLIDKKACDIFNVRLSKCGGIFRSLEIINLAISAGLDYQIGCHVGESGILSASARHLVAVVRAPKYLEGSYSRFILREDVIREDLSPKEGIAYGIDGPGLGVGIKEHVIRRHSKEKFLVS